MKKTLLSLGTLVSTIAPVASVIACGDGDVPGHEAPYSITIQADAIKPTQANVEIKLKGFVSDSYLKEIKSKLVEIIAAANKGESKYSTIKIWVGNNTVPINVFMTLTKLIDISSLTNENKSDLEAIHNLIDSNFDTLINEIKANKQLKQFFREGIWENQHHQIDKVNKDEIKRNILKYLGYKYSDPNVINFEYEVISDKYIDFTITRTNVAVSPELTQNIFSVNTSYFDFLEGEKINVRLCISDDGKVNFGQEDGKQDSYLALYNSKQSNKNDYLMIATSAYSPINAYTQLYKITKYLLKANGYEDNLVIQHDLTEDYSKMIDHLKTLGNSANKVFAYGENGQIVGMKNKQNAWAGGANTVQEFKVDYDKKTFNVKFICTTGDQKQWIFGKDGHSLTMEPNKEWSITLEGAYELNSTGDALESISSLTKATGSDGTNTVNILDSSAKIIAKSLFNDGPFPFFKENKG